MWWSMIKGFSKQIASSMLAIRESMVWLVPCLLLSSLILFVASIGELFLGGRTWWIENLYRANESLNLAFPYLMTAAISFVMATQWRLPRPPIALLSIFFLIVSSSWGESAEFVQVFYVVMAILTPLYAVPCVAKLSRFRWTQITSSESAGQIVKESLNMVIPALLTAILVVMVNGSALNLLASISFGSVMDVSYANEPYTFGLVYTFCNSVLWFFGIHGYYALLPFAQMLQEGINLSYSTMLAGGEVPYPMNLSLMGAFVFIGGSGSTFSLVLMLLLFSKQRSYRLLALASIPIGLVNVNELMLFGLPIIFNLRLLGPFILAPMMNVLLSLGAIKMGWVAAPSVPIPFNSPILINAWLATNGDWHAVLLQLFNIFVGCLIYAPSVLRMNRAWQGPKINMATIDTVYTRMREEAQILHEDPVMQAKRKEQELLAMERRLLTIQNKEFSLQYQVQMNPSASEVKGCEALLRVVDSEGKVEYPGTFLPWLENAGLMKDIDLWVFRQVVKDIRRWSQQGIYMPVSINITAETLVDDEYMDVITCLIEPFSGQIHIELTEQTLLADEEKLSPILEQLHLLGAKVFIDDFGTGYSSLSYLNRFDIDGIKIDRSFVLALNTEKGRKVFASLQSVAQALNLELVVEGVETVEQLNRIEQQHSVAIQGWYYGKAMKIDELIDFVQATHQQSRSRTKTNLTAAQ